MGAEAVRYFQHKLGYLTGGVVLWMGYAEDRRLCVTVGLGAEDAFRTGRVTEAGLMVHRNSGISGCYRESECSDGNSVLVERDEKGYCGFGLSYDFIIVALYVDFLSIGEIHSRSLRPVHR